MKAKLALAIAIVAAAVQAQVATCSGSGLTVAGGRLGDVFTLEIEGPPGAAAILATDVAGGPLLTPYGSICLGMTPGLVISPCALDADGRFGFGGVLPLAGPFPVGSTIALQAALAHPTLPGGFTLTNGVAATIRSPRLALFHFACWMCGQPTSLHLVDGVTDTVAVTLPSIPWNGGRIVHLKRPGWFGWKVSVSPSTPPASVPANLPPSGSFICIDDQTGATTLTIPNVWTMGGEEWAVSEDGETLTVVLTGAAPHYDRFWVKTYALPSGSLLSVQAVSSPGYAPHGIHHVPGTSIAYIASTDKFHVFDGASGTEIATVFLPGNLNNAGYGASGRSFVHQGMLYCVAGNSMVKIDTSTHAILGQGPAVAGPIVVHGLGPGSAGPSVWATIATGSSPMGPCELFEVPLATLTPNVVTALTEQPQMATPSAGGTEMLFGFLASTVALNGASHAMVSMPGLIAPTVLRSNTLTKAYGWSISNPSASAVASFSTDPCVGAFTVIPAPMGLPMLSN